MLINPKIVGPISSFNVRLMELANAFHFCYKAKERDNLTEAAKLHRRANDYTSLTDLGLATEAYDLSQRVAANQAALKKAYNLTDDAIAALATDAALFDALLSSPQLAIDGAKIKGATAKPTLSALNDFLRDELRAGMELLKDTHEDAYKALREASQVDDARCGKVGEKRKGDIPLGTSE